jgi:myosin heavy chain 9/10/11/14
VDRTVRDLQGQIERRDKQNSQLADEIESKRDRIERLLSTVDELQSADSQVQLSLRRTERELREEREERLRLERELEGWKGLRVERSALGSVAGRFSENGGRRSSVAGSVRVSRGESMRRQLSTSKVLL